MRPIYISVLFCLMTGNIFSQEKTGDPQTKSNPPANTHTVTIRCSVNTVNNEVLWVVNGLLSDTASVRKIDPVDIESIDILKEGAATAIYGCRAAQGVIILTTRSARLKKFMVKDATDDHAIPGATLTFVSLKNTNDSLRFIADESGMVSTTDLPKGEEYKVLISSVGYQTMSSMYQPAHGTAANLYRLVRDVRENEKAVVVGYINGRRGCGWCMVRSTIYYHNDLTNAGTLPVRIFPNPLPGGAAVKVEINIENEKPLQIRITNLSGTVLRSVTHRSFKGLNRVEVPTAGQWAAGMYFVQVLDEKGKLLKQDKLLIQ